MMKILLSLKNINIVLLINGKKRNNPVSADISINI